VEVSGGAGPAAPTSLWTGCELNPVLAAQRGVVIGEAGSNRRSPTGRETAGAKTALIAEGLVRMDPPP
jgi:hypothetical protein